MAGHLRRLHWKLHLHGPEGRLRTAARARPSSVTPLYADGVRQTSRRDCTFGVPNACGRTRYILAIMSQVQRFFTVSVALAAWYYFFGMCSIIIIICPALLYFAPPQYASHTSRLHVCLCSPAYRVHAKRSASRGTRYYPRSALSAKLERLLPTRQKLRRPL